ncbi:hypothetical protein DMA11_18460 [Marinilabiliaceae bacterium JC017]|nr:hypothetical protein DMA11_18460 [Marinilabiliaceae bacterium JC017]
MNYKIIGVFMLLLTQSVWITAFSCTTFLISGKHTSDGKPMLFKHRDSDSKDNALRYFSDGKYDYIGLVNATVSSDNMVWAGYNSAGFAIMNSAAYTLTVNDTTSLQDQEGVVMKKALQQCATLADFEKLLNELPRPMGVDANFGVIDAQGGAAYYETGNYGFKKVDANDPLLAPHGILIRTNYSFSDNVDEGYGYIRFASAQEALYDAAAAKKLSPEYLFNHVSRNLVHGLTKADLSENLPENLSDTRFVSMDDYISRFSSTAATLIVGVAPGEKVNQTMMWTILGMPLCSVAVPTWLAGGKALPEVVARSREDHAPLCDAALVLHDKLFSIKRGSGYKYIDQAWLLNKENTGIMQKLAPIEQQVFSETATRMSQWNGGDFNKKNVQAYYQWLDNYLREAYKAAFDLVL